MNSPNKSATISVADFLFFTIFSNTSYPELVWIAKKLIVNQLRSQQKAVLMTNYIKIRFGINKQPSGFILSRLTATKQS